MSCRFALPSWLAMTAFSTSAMAFSANNLASCIGNQFVQLQAPPSAERMNSTSAATCLKREHLSICRAMLDGDQPDDRTMKITVSVNGAVMQEWFEDADPAYFKHIHAFVAQNNNIDSPILIATQQSESQGMGVQEWLINTITTAGRHTFTTSEFGTMGSLVFDRRTSASACKILLTRWESRQTNSGERLFLVGHLVDLDAPDDAHQHHPPPRMLRRLDRRLEQLRSTEPADRPLIYFKR